MTPVKMNSYAADPRLTQSQSVKKTANEARDLTPATQTDNKQVNISAEGKALLAEASKADASTKTTKVDDDSLGDKVESFAYGALGMDEPDAVEGEVDNSYTAGQFLKGALSVGALLLAVV